MCRGVLVYAKGEPIGWCQYGTREELPRVDGGLVEAYPVSKSDQGLNYLYCGTVRVFEKAGFKTIASLATGRTPTVVMRRTI